MGWWIFFLIVFTTTLLLVPKDSWKRLFFAGIAGLFIVLPIDSTLVTLGAFKFNFNELNVLGLPLPYWISYIPGGILFAHFHPTKWLQRLLYIIFSAASYALIEFITMQSGLFQHLNWNILNSFILNILGFTTLTWFIEWYFSN